MSTPVVVSFVKLIHSRVTYDSLHEEIVYISLWGCLWGREVFLTEDTAHCGRQQFDWETIKSARLHSFPSAFDVGVVRPMVSSPSHCGVTAGKPCNLEL